MILAELLLLISLSLRNEQQDGELAGMIRSGDHVAFRTFFDRYHAQLFSFLMSKGMSRDDANDLLQQAFLTIWEKRSDLKPELSLRSFLFTIAYNRMRNHIRDQGRLELQFAFTLTDGTQNPAEETEITEAMKAMQRALEVMPERRREVFELCYLQELTYKEAAEALGLTRKTVENHMALALKDLRGALKIYFPI